MRKKILHFLGRCCGLKKGQMLPKWLMVVQYMLFPSMLRYVWNAYDFRTHTISVGIGDTRVSLRMLMFLGTQDNTDQWFRVCGRTSNIPEIEIKTTSEIQRMENSS